MVGPEISRRLTYRENLKVSLSQGFAVVIATGISVFQNYLKRRPLHASMIKHVSAAAVGYIAGREIDKYKERKRNAHLLILRDYMAKHPEDFPVGPPKKYKDILLPWSPVR